jgi:hypothetical protein
MESEHHPYAMTITMLVLICVIITLIRPLPVHFTFKQRHIAFTVRNIDEYTRSIIYTIHYTIQPNSLLTHLP